GRRLNDSLVPYTTLFRSRQGDEHLARHGDPLAMAMVAQRAGRRHQPGKVVATAKQAQLPIVQPAILQQALRPLTERDSGHAVNSDRKSTRLNSSHVKISY